MSQLRTWARRLLNPRVTAWGRIVTRGKTLPQWGNLRRTSPLSDSYGFDRGTPIDRFYLHRFLDANRAAITGDVLEIQVSSYTQRYGSNLRDVHTVDVNATFNPTYHCDLAAAAGIIARDRYDCFLLPNTLQHVERIDDALREALRVVRPGGTILASNAVLVRLNSPTDDFWRLSAAGWRKLAERAWPGCEIEIQASGNCLAAVAAMYGLALEELSERELLVQDDRYPVLVTIRCRKPR